MLRGLFTACAILSLLLLAAMAALWVRSYGVRDTIRYRTDDGVVGAFASRGAVALGWGGRGGPSMFYPVDYSRRRPIDLASSSAWYPEVYGMPGVFAVQIGQSRLMGYRRLIVLHDGILIVLLAILPAWWAVRAPRRPAGRLCPSCGQHMPTTPGTCPGCGASVGVRPAREPSAAGPVVRVTVVVVGLVVFFVWVWQYGSPRHGVTHDDVDSPARAWQDVPRGR